MPLLPLDEATPILDRLAHGLDRLREPQLHVLSPVERVGDWFFRKCGCGCVWSGDRAIDAPEVCAVADLDADLLANLARLLEADAVLRERLRRRQQLEQMQLRGALSAA